MSEKELATWRGSNKSVNIKSIKTGKTSRIKHHYAQSLVDLGTHVYISQTEYRKSNMPVLTPIKSEPQQKERGERVRRGKKGKK